MNPKARKLILPLEAARYAAAAAPLRALYVLAEPGGDMPRDRIHSTGLSPREAFLALIEHTFNYRIASPGRLQRLLWESERLVATLPVRRLSYPRDLRRLAAVRGAIVEEVAGLAAGCRQFSPCPV